MKVDFWQLSRDPVEKVVAMIAGRVIETGDRLLIVSAKADQRKSLSRGLWQAGPENFLANGEADGEGAERQPILLAGDKNAVNGASHVIYADGEWRGEDGFDRAFLLFSEETKPAAREAWKSLDDVEGLERSYFEQDGGKWVKIA